MADCPPAGFGVRITYDPATGTFTIDNPGGYCGPPTMTGLIPDSWSPFSLTFSYDVSSGNHCDCGGTGGTMTITITE